MASDLRQSTGVCCRFKDIRARDTRLGPLVDTRRRLVGRRRLYNTTPFGRTVSLLVPWPMGVSVDELLEVVSGHNTEVYFDINISLSVSGRSVVNTIMVNWGHSRALHSD
jgi:hypothetical protein